MIQLQYEDLPSEALGETVVTMGNFDGVHLGHQTLVQSAVSDSNTMGVQCVVVTFHPHPAAFFHKNGTIPTICSENYKAKLMQRLDADAILTLHFNAVIASMDPETFIHKILIERLNAKVLWIGYDFKFGRERSGNVRTLIELGEKYDIRTNVLSPQRKQGMVVSSSRIREFIVSGNVGDAASLLERKHLIRGTVIHGDAVGRTLGFPTVNLHVTEGMIPGMGIYSGVARVRKKTYPAAIYIGHRPSLPGNSLRVEAYLIDFSGDLYANRVSLAFLRFIRKEAAFSKISELKKMIALDCDNTVKDYSDYMARAAEEPIIW